MTPRKDTPKARPRNDDDHAHTYGRFVDCFGYRYLKCSCGSIRLGWGEL